MSGSPARGIQTVLHPVSDVATAKEVYAGLPGAPAPQGMTSPVASRHVPDLEAKLAEVTAAGARVQEPADPDGNVLGLLQDR